MSDPLERCVQLFNLCLMTAELWMEKITFAPQQPATPIKRAIIISHCVERV